MHSRGLEDFIVCPEHQKALETVMGFCQSLSQQIEHRPSPSLLYLHGDIGVGKTHLLQSVLSECRKDGLQVDIQNVHSFPPKFGYPFRKKTDTPDWKHFANLDLLVIDDLQHILGWREERVHTFITKLIDHCITEKRGIIFTGLDALETRDGSHPLGFNEALLQRMKKGINVEMGMPGPNTKMEILQRYAEEFPSTFLGTKIDSNILEWLAGLNRNPRSLLCCMVHLKVIAEAESLSITLDVAKERLADWCSV